MKVSVYLINGTEETLQSQMQSLIYLNETFTLLSDLDMSPYAQLLQL